MVGAAAKKLIQKVPVGVVDFHAIETGFLGELGTVDVFGNDSGELGGFEGAGCDIIDHLFAGKDLSFGSDGRGGDRKCSVRLKAGMGDATDVPELEEDAAPCGMNGLDDFFPSADLFGGVDARGVGVAVAEGGDGGGLANDESRGGALAVVFGVEIVGNVACGGPASGQGRHQNPVR